MIASLGGDVKLFAIRAVARFFVTGVGGHYPECRRHEFCGGVGGVSFPRNFPICRLGNAIFSTFHEMCLRNIDLEGPLNRFWGGSSPPLLATALAILSVSSIRPVHANCSSSELGNITSSFSLISRMNVFISEF